ncbi:hypothetical protein HMPREF2851_03855 [Actinomyces sp. HMSC064C12]|nr:hypothetical protein HMPREF2851_03855 [Actinomyces sp. HMSC064C12]
MRDANLLSPNALWLAWILVAVATALMFSLAAGAKKYFRKAFVALLAGGGASAITLLVIDYLWVPFPDGLDWHIYIWIVLAVSALVMGGFALGIKAPTLARATRFLGALVAVAVFAAGASLGTNAVYQAYPTMESFFGPSKIDTVSWKKLHLAAGSERKLDAKSFGNIPKRGVLTKVTIPGKKSGFRARPANIYLPPAALGPRPPKLPVLVLLAGIPGTPNDWVRLGNAPMMAERYASTHSGVAPILVLADVTGSTTYNTLCADSTRGNASTYATKDMPEWVKANLPAAASADKWLVAGVSFGGTCAVQFALQAPNTYRHFFDMSGEAEQKIGTRRYTIQHAFAGDAEKWKLYQIPPLLQNGHFPAMSGRFGLGIEDKFAGAKTRRVHAQAKKKGIDVGQIVYTQGRHSWAVWRSLLKQQWPWMMQQLGIEKGK